MKKIILNIAIIAAAALSLSSCSDFLEQSVRGQENLDTYFQTETECLKQVTGCYQSLAFDDWWQVYNFYLASDMCTDDMWMGNTTQDASGYRDFAHYTGNANTDCSQNYWQYRYKGILRCNIVINKVPTAPISDEILRARMLAEAKFLRAYQYFELVNYFGGVPLMLEMKMPEETKGMTRSTVAEIYAQIEIDLSSETIEALPKKSEYSASDMGRVTKGAAQSLLAKAYLFQGKYAEALTQLKEVVKNSNEYDLFTDFGKVWSIEGNNGIESIFEIQTSSDLTYNLGERISIVCGSRDDSGWSWGLPTSNLEQAFLNEGDTERLKWTIIKHNATEIPGDPTCTPENPYLIMPDKHKSARVSRKLYIPVDQRPTPYDASHIPLNYRLIRYADVLLMYAEVQNQLGDDGEARWALNKVRNRAKLTSKQSSGKELRDDIRLERRLELALENQRLYDIRRWTDDNGKKAVCNIMGTNGSFVKYNMETSTDTYEKTNQKENSNKGYYFNDDRDLLFPLPHAEVSLSGGTIEQNPNYN